MMTREKAWALAQDWAAAWNQHDLQLVLSHYTDDFEMTSPFISSVTGNGSDTLKGKEQVGAYWQKALQQFPDLHFDLHDVAWNHTGIVLYYTSVGGRKAMECLQLNEQQQVFKAVAYYNQ